MPTAKQVRHHYKKIMRAWYRLDQALRDAHNANIIEYEGYDGVAPCQSHGYTKDRVKKTTQKAIVEAFHREIIRELKEW